MAKLIGSVDPKNDQREFKVPEDMTLYVDNWTELTVFFPAGAEIHLPNQRNGINPSTGKPVRGTGYVLVTVEDAQRKIIYVLKESGGIVSFECRPQPITYRRYTSSVPYPPTLA